MIDTIERVRAVETSLRPLVPVLGEDPRWNLADRMERYGLAGVSIAVIDDGRIDWVRSYGSIEAGSGVPVDCDTLFQAASMSKVAAAFLVMQQVERGRLDLDADVNRYLHSWRLPVSELTRDNPVTLRKILSHRAGLTVGGFVGYPVDAPLPTVTQVLDGEAPANSDPVVVDITPGTQQRYSGGGTTIAQLVLEEMTGKSFGDLAREELFAPLGMSRSTFAQPLPRALEANAARGHRPDRSVLAGGWHVFVELAAAGLWTTPSEYARLFLEIREARLGRSVLLGESAATEMLTRQPGGFFALGPRVTGTPRAPRFEHGGANQGYRCETLLYLDSGKGVVVMTNGDLGTNFCYEVFNAVATVYEWPDHIPAPRQVMRLTSDAVDALVGEYRAVSGFDPTLPITVSLQDGRLMSRIEGQPPTEMLAESATAFFSREHPYEIRFCIAEDGRATGFIVLEGGEEVIRAVRFSASGEE